ncbi:putative uncharacterized leucine-rich repeat-containing protein C926.06c [[Candida] jaroonii]|uniref:Uncharacterized leucine-rich repeat-containing protein C926.06c n=1 Tax=[Candida] jaroonii TaxID=467808 RepID=A0ACA9YCT1_9ASCO|nr:putative uncharacterized leucine-rich repeat-containing protein C926.06c [[Candida] jaroonii]
MGAISNDSSIEGEVYIQKLSSYIKRNEEGLANGLLIFSKSKHNPKIKPSRLSFSLHHLYYISEKIDNSSLGVDVGPLNIRLDNPNHEPTFISFMANNARNSKHFDSDTRSISSINSMRSIVSNASLYWRNFNVSKDPKVIKKDIKYLYSSFTKIPCLILSPKTKINGITGYEEYPCDTSVPMRMFKNLQVLEIVDYEPNEIFGWNFLSDQLRILIIKNSKMNDLAELIFTLVVDDENGRSSLNSIKNIRRSTTSQSIAVVPSNGHNDDDYKFRRERSHTNTGGEQPHLPHSQSSMPFSHSHSHSYSYSHITLPQYLQGQHTFEQSKEYSLDERKWSFLRQLSIIETSITNIPSYIFKPLSNLVKLNLSNNLLEEIPDGLRHLVNIKYLNFSDNYITKLSNLPNNLKQLTTLNFNNNKITNLDGLQNLHSLEKIDLRKNSLTSINSLKPILFLFIKNNEQFNNVYLAHNPLPKNFRIDLFNLLNGIKYKNDFKIDDSKPGYFESVMLLDNESAIRNLHNFFKNLRTESAPDETFNTSFENDVVNSLSVLNLEEDRTITPLSNNSNLTNLTSDLGKLKKSTTLNNLSESKNTPTSIVTQVQVTARMST